MLYLTESHRTMIVNLSILLVYKTKVHVLVIKGDILNSCHVSNVTRMKLSTVTNDTKLDLLFSLEENSVMLAQDL